MKDNYIISKDAENDLQEIGDFIALDNPDAASTLIDKFTEGFERTVLMPEIGYKKPEWTKKDIRFLSIKKYIIVYQINDKGITILRILSNYRDITGLLDY